MKISDMLEMSIGKLKELTKEVKILENENFNQRFQLRLKQAEKEEKEDKNSYKRLYKETGVKEL